MRTLRVGDVTVKASTTDPAKSGRDTFTYIDLSSVDQAFKEIVDPKTLESRDAPSRARQIVAEGDVLVATVRPNLNGVAKVPADLNGAIASTGFTVLRPQATALDSNFLFQWVKSPAFVSDMMAKSTGASYPAVSDRIIKESQIPFPPLDEQRRIAAILDKADELRTKRRQALAQLDALTQSIFHEMFGTVPATTTLGALCRNRFRNGVSPSTRGSLEQHVLTLSAVTGSAFDPAAVKTSTFDKPIPDSNRVSTQLLLICRGNGNRTLVGRGYFPRVDLHDVGYPDTVIAAEPDTRVVEPRFLEVAWGLPTTRAQLEGAAKTTNGTFKINQASLAAVELPLPPLELQQTFATRVAAVERLKESHRKHLAELEALFASLQHRAFKGEL